MRSATACFKENAICSVFVLLFANEKKMGISDFLDEGSSTPGPGTTAGRWSARNLAAQQEESCRLGKEVSSALTATPHWSTSCQIAGGFRLSRSVDPSVHCAGKGLGCSLFTRVILKLYFPPWANGLS